MKKQTIVMIIALVIICLAPTIRNKIMNSVIRYETPEESLKKSGPRGADLVDVFEDKGIALVIWKEKDGVFSDEIIAKDNRGWTTLTVTYKDYKKTRFDNGFVCIKEIKGKYVVEVMIIVREDEGVPNSIVDNLESKFILNSYTIQSGGKIVYGLLVSEEKFPDDYKVIIDGLEVPLY